MTTLSEMVSKEDREDSEVIARLLKEDDLRSIVCLLREEVMVLKHYLVILCKKSFPDLDKTLETDEDIIEVFLAIKKIGIAETLSSDFSAVDRPSTPAISASQVSCVTVEGLNDVEVASEENFKDKDDVETAEVVIDKTLIAKIGGFFRRLFPKPERYDPEDQTVLRSFVEMGFKDEEKNKELMAKHNGLVSKVVDKLLTVAAQ